MIQPNSKVVVLTKPGVRIFVRDPDEQFLEERRAEGYEQQKEEQQ